MMTGRGGPRRKALAKTLATAMAMTLPRASAFLSARCSWVRGLATRAEVPQIRPHTRTQRVMRMVVSQQTIGSATTQGGMATDDVKSSFLQIMIERGFFHQCSDLAGLDKKLNAGEPIAAYLGFDATADSLHVGSLLQIMILRHLQRCGHKPVVLVGGGTTKVGDPSGKDESRQMLDEAAIQRNIAGISSVFAKFLVIGEDATDATFVNNDDWLGQLRYIDFLRSYGPHFTVNRMMNFESVRLRLEREQPLTFLEFNYMLLQAYDFLELWRRMGVCLQMGGSDQWGNMINGVELGRRVDGAELFAMTAPLITTSDGKKMGKTAGGAVWLNGDKVPPYDYWQFWRNTDDADVARFLRLFTELPLPRIAELARLEGADINQAKVVLADEATGMLHGRDCLVEIHDTVAQLFAAGGAGGGGSGGGGGGAALPSVVVTAAEVEAGGLAVVDLYIRLGLASTKGEVRRLMQGGGARLNDERVDQADRAVGPADFREGQLKLSSGKKKHGLVKLVG